jgi:poly-gamma-glutamate synthesis protein (capsule biosynthesis protein)
MSGGAKIRLLFGGDFAPNGAYEDLIASRGGSIFGAVQEFIDRADLSVVNLEAPICEGGEGIRKVGPALRAGSGTLRALSEAGIKAVCLANNHILDYGREGLGETLRALQANGISHVGAGLDREAAEAPLRYNIRDKTISIFSFAEREFNVSEDGSTGAAILDPIRMAQIVLKERKQTDVVIIVFHGGNEYFPYPRPGLRRLCHFLVEIGADAVIGHHPHVPGPYEIYQGKPIVYSLGNLIFDHESPPLHWDEGYMANLELEFAADGLTTFFSLVPYRQAVAEGGVLQMDADVRAGFLSRIEAMRSHVEGEPKKWLLEWNRFVEQKRDQLLIDMFAPIRFRGLRWLLAFPGVAKLIMPRSRRLHRLNLLRCASHLELLSKALEEPARSNPVETRFR